MTIHVSTETSEIAAPISARSAPTASESTEPHSIPATVDRVASGAVAKAAAPLTHLWQSLVGGSFVSFGALLSLVVSTGITTPGLSSLVMGLAFGFSLVLILAAGMSLITADMAAGFIAVLQRRVSVIVYLRFLVIGLVGNVVGALVFVTVAAAAGGPYLNAPFVQRVVAVAVAKTSAPDLTAILLAVLCTWFLQTAMVMYFKARTEGGRIAFAFYGPFAFVAGGTQHVIANVGFIGLPLLLQVFHPDAAIAAQSLNWGFGANGLLHNVVLTTIGNFIGGAVFVALPFVVIARRQVRAAAGR